MPVKYGIVIGIVSLILLGAIPVSDDDWGFYSHRLINKTAVFTLPIDLLPLYKDNIEYITEHAIDPDKRRYTSPLEAVRHYIDIDVWGTPPFDQLPRDLAEAMMRYSSVFIMDQTKRDTIRTWKGIDEWQPFLQPYQQQRLSSELSQRTIEIQEEGFISLPDDWLPDEYAASGHQLIFVEYFSKQGILPYHLVAFQQRLTNAFREENWSSVIRLSAEMGHYLADAHVPLHTTVNYNGQLSDQDGIHAFWESRIPELFAADKYNLFVPKARYIEDKQTWFWSIVLESHSLVHEVLRKELEVRGNIQKDQQFCFEERGGITVRLACKKYAEAYQNAMAGMVEKQMRAAIENIGSSWYTAWIDAGKPAIGTSEIAIEWKVNENDRPLDSMVLRRFRTDIHSPINN